jgi:DNA-binding transcriptional MerR regulator
MATVIPHSARVYSIGQAATASGVSAPNIRFYEKEALIPPRGGGDNGYRSYREADVHQLRFIRLLRSLDMSLDEVRTLLALNLSSKSDCQTARDTLDAHIGHVRERLKELRALEKQLAALREQCDGRGDQCHLIEALHQASEQQSPPAVKRAKRHAPL